MDTKILALAVAGAVAYHENAFNVQPKIDDAVENIKNIETSDVFNKSQTLPQNTSFVPNVDDETLSVYKTLQEKALRIETASNNQSIIKVAIQRDAFESYLASLSSEEKEMLMQKGKRFLETLNGLDNKNITPYEGADELRAIARKSSSGGEQDEALRGLVDIVR